VDPIIADRYGLRAEPRTEGRRRRVVIAAAVAIVVAVGLVAWAAFSREDSVSWLDRGVSTTADTATVTFQVSLPRGAQATCTVRVVNEVRLEVGRTDVVVGPSDETVIRGQVTMRTSEPAVDGGVRDCVRR